MYPRRTAFVGAVALFFCLQQVATSQQRIQFDVSRTVACFPIESDGQPLAQVDERLVQARVSVSVLANQGAAEDISECLYRFDNEASNVQIVDYRPRTTMDTSIAGNIRIQGSEESNSQLSLNLDGGLEMVRGSAGGSRGKAVRSSWEYERIPPQEMVAAVGTTGRGTGVYFKLRRTERVSLEGSREFLMTLRVPATWRGGVFRATCRAVSRSAEGEYVLGAGTFVVPLYLAGDLAAKQDAAELSTAEHALRVMASQKHREIKRRSKPTLAHELSFVEPEIPWTWLQQVFDQRSLTQRLPFEGRLPADLQATVEAYRRARLRLSQPRSRISTKGTVVADVGTDVLNTTSSSQSATNVGSETGPTSSSNSTYVRVQAWRPRS